MIEMREVTKSYGQTAAVSGLTMTVEDGDILGVFGANGAGKSTLLRMLAGVLKPDGGSVRIDGADPERDWGSKETVFFLPDEQHFDAGETVRATARFYARFYRSFDREVFARLCESFELRQADKISRLSKGMKKQVMMITAISVRPKYILLDEVFDGIDSISKQTLKNALLRLSAEYGTTVVTASHNIREIEDVCRSVCLLYKSKLVLHRKTDELKSAHEAEGGEVGLEEILTKELEAQGYAGKNIDFI